MSRSLRRKNVVGPDGPGFEVAGGLKADLLDLSVRASDGAYMLVVGQWVNERAGLSESIGGVLQDCVLRRRCEECVFGSDVKAPDSEG